MQRTSGCRARVSSTRSCRSGSRSTIGSYHSVPLSCDKESLSRKAIASCSLRVKRNSNIETLPDCCRGNVLAPGPNPINKVFRLLRSSCSANPGEAGVSKSSTKYPDTVFGSSNNCNASIAEKTRLSKGEVISIDLIAPTSERVRLGAF